jgi:hypothetical protein
MRQCRKTADINPVGDDLQFGCGCAILDLWFRAALDRGWKMNSMVLWYFECLFRLGQHRELRRAILEFGRGVTAQDELPSDVRDAVTLWMQVA